MSTPHPTDDSNPVESTEAVPLFPTFVWKTQLKREVFAPLNEGMRRRLGELTQEQPPLRSGEKFQTEQQLHRLPEFSDFAELILATSRGVLDFLRLSYNELEITGCWANISAVGTAHKTHTHPNNFLSGVYYLQADPGATHITFDDPRPQTNIMSPVTLEITAENAGQIHLGIQEGMLVMFPAWLAHSVPVNESQRERISIAFNVMFKRFGEEMGAPKWEGNVPIR